MGTIGKYTMILGDIRELAWTDQSFWLDFRLGHSGLITRVANRADLGLNSLPAETEIISNDFALGDSRNRAPEQAALIVKQRIE
jgi:hypothetical protein